MKKVFSIFLSLIVLMSLSAYKKGYRELTFESFSASTISLQKIGEPFDISLEYSLDGKNWKSYSIGEDIYLLDEDILFFRAGETGNRRFSKGIDDYYQFDISGEVAARGSIMSLLDRKCGHNSVPSYAFFNLFRDCASLTEAPELPAMKLADCCYSSMFHGCTGLTKEPVLPATELADCCYYFMFKGCTSLTKAPALPARELAEACYYCMFVGCENLIKAPALPATELAEGCYSWMFAGCENLTKAPALPATKLAEGCYECMFSDCTSLTKAPALPATELAEECYSSMFEGCTKLNYVKALFTDEPSEETTGSWLSGVATNGTFVKSKYATWDVRGKDGIPEGWTVVAE